MRVWHSLLIICLAVGAAGCNQQQPAAEPEEASAPEPSGSWSGQQQAQLERATRAREVLASTLMGELTEALDSEGPAGAVEVCRTIAPEVAAEVATNHGVAIGRTSFRLRNQANQPPVWAREAVVEQVAEATTFAGPAGELGVLTPIFTKAECTMCHGTVEETSDAAMAAIRDLYPADQAVDFAEGDLRGWFWVEVPAAAGPDAT
jgi:hypothetical protein